MQGACDEFAKAGCALSGGHTVDDPEVKLGFSITGKITDGKIYKNIGLREGGDLLIYTKPLGIGSSPPLSKLRKLPQKTSQRSQRPCCKVIKQHLR